MRELKCINWFNLSYFQQEVYLLQWGNLFLETVDCKYSTLKQKRNSFAARQLGTVFELIKYPAVRTFHRFSSLVVVFYDCLEMPKDSKKSF